MVSKKEYLRKKSPFNIFCMIKELNLILSCLPTIGQKSVETKLKNLIIDYAKTKTKQDGIPKLELV